MATELDQTSTLQALADSTAIIIDRAAVPEKIVGQAWLISKGRVVTLASVVSNYADAPYALLIRFPHPNLSYSVRTVTLHPDFNKREARDYYLAQARGPLPPYTGENDVATMALDSDTTPPEAARMAEVNRALSVPFEISPQDMSGTMRSGDVPQILQSVLSTGRMGLLTMMDTRNIPFARLAVKQTRIVRANFQSLYNEVAVCELLWRQPPGSFVFQPQEFRWPPDIPEIATPTEQLLAEAQRRFDELPQLLDSLGGGDNRFIRIAPTADFNQVPQNDRWLIERLWEALDGYLPLSKLADRVGADSYGVAKQIYQLASMGLLNVEQNALFHNNGQLGPLILPAQELELNTWDSLTAFSLDPQSGCPVSYGGNFFGGAHAINAKTLLHTIPVPQYIGPAIVLKDGKFVGLHSGAFPLKGVVNPPPIALHRMMWVGALNDLGTKRLRTAEATAAEAASGDMQLAQEQAMIQRTSMRMKSLTEPSAAEPPKPMQEDPQAAANNIRILAGAGLMFILGLGMMLFSFFSPHGQSGSAPQPVAQVPAKTATASASTASQTEEKPLPGKFDKSMGDESAAKIAYDLIGIATPPDTYVFKDSSKLTDPKRSFELTSDAKNFDFLFVEWPNQSPLEDLDLIAKHLPCYDLLRCDPGHNEATGQGPHVVWADNHYVSNDDSHTVTNVQVGVWDIHKDGKTVVYICRPLSGQGLPDVDYPADFVENLIAEGEKTRVVADQGKSALPDGALATPAQLGQYRDKLAALIKSNYKPPHYDIDTNTKVALAVTIDSKGNITEMNLKPNPNDDFNKALQKAVDLSSPLPSPPRTKQGSYAVTISAHADDINVDEQ